jgi:AraC-like DNA-binding protein
MMAKKYIDINTITDLHQMVHFGAPKHPLVSLVEHETNTLSPQVEDVAYRAGFYTVSCKKILGDMQYGRGSYDFSNGTLMLVAPGQVITPGSGIIIEQGWSLFFHPDLLHGTDLSRKIHEYNFFNYEVNEALHVSEDEESALKDCADKIKKEYSQNIDKHTQELIVSNIILLLNYCNRFYDRQFYTRTSANSDLLQRFERLLKEYFVASISMGLPSVSYFAAQLNLSPYYLSDLLLKVTGKTTLEHIHLEIIKNAKSLLLSTDESISGIAYSLGFEHASHFTKLFKTKTGTSPSDYRKVN